MSQPPLFLFYQEIKFLKKKTPFLKTTYETRYVLVVLWDLFLRKLVPGGSAHSFVIPCTQDGRISHYVLKTEKEKLMTLESSYWVLNKKEIRIIENEELIQMSFFKLDDSVLEFLAQMKF